MKQLTPHDDNSPSKLSEYAQACDILGRRDEARKAYQRVLAVRPKDDAARVRLLLLLTEKDNALEAIEKNMRQLTDAGCSELGQALAARFDDREGDYEQRLRAAEIAVRLLVIQKDRPRSDVQWALQLLPSLGGQLSSNRMDESIPSLYDCSGEEDGAEGGPAYATPSVDAKLLERRAKLHRRLCLLMIDVPELGRLGFQHLLAATEARLATERKKSAAKHAKTPAVPEKAKPLAPPKEDCRAASHRLPKDLADEFQKYAEKVLLAEAQPKLRHFPGGMTQYSSSYASDADDPDEIDFRCPEEYLATMAWRSGDWGRIDKVLLPKLDQARDRRGCKLLRQLASLYRCASKDYLAAAAPIAKEPRSGDGLAIVVNVWLTRGLTVDLQPMILDSLRRGVRRMTDQETPTLCPIRYLERLAAQGRMKQAEEAIEEVAEVCLGPLEKRAEFVKRGFPGRGRSSGGADARIQFYSGFLQRLAQSSAFFARAVERAELYKEIAENDETLNGFSRSAEQLAKRSPTVVAAMLEASLWTAGAERFRVLALGPNVSQWPIVHLLENLSDDRSEPVWKMLDEKQKSCPAFGRGLLLAIHAQQMTKSQLARRDRAAGVQATENDVMLNYVGKQLGAIEKLPTQQQMDVARLVNVNVPDKVADGSATGAARQWLERQLTARSLQIVDKFRKAKKIEELGLQNPEPSELGQYFGGVLPDILRTDAKTACELFSRTVTLYQAYQKSPRAQNTFYPSSYSYETTPAGVILEQTLTQCNGEGVEPKVLLFVVDVLGSSGGAKIPPPESSVLKNLIQWLMRPSDEQADEDDAEEMYSPSIVCAG